MALVLRKPESEALCLEDNHRLVPSNEWHEQCTVSSFSIAFVRLSSRYANGHHRNLTC